MITALIAAAALGTPTSIVSLSPAWTGVPCIVPHKHHKGAPHEPLQSCAAPRVVPPCPPVDELTLIPMPRVVYVYLAPPATDWPPTWHSEPILTPFPPLGGEYGWPPQTMTPVPTPAHQTPEIDTSSGVIAIVVLAIGLMLIDKRTPRQ